MDKMIAIVIVDYRSERQLRRCLESLRCLKHPRLSYIVVDNGDCLDASGLQGAYGNLTILSPKRNLGFGGGCNLGIRHALDAGAAYILLLNPDARADGDFLTPLIDVMESHPRLGMVSPTVRRDDRERRIEYAGGALRWLTGRVICVTDDRFADSAPFAPVPFLTGCAMLLRAEAIRAVGPMEEAYFLYFEDADYTLAFLRQGWQAGYVPKAVVVHAGSGTTGYLSETYLYHFARNRIWFMRRWARPSTFAVFTLFNILLRLPGTIAVLTLAHRKPRLVRAFLRGFRDGLRRSPVTP